MAFSSAVCAAGLRHRRTMEEEIFRATEIEQFSETNNIYEYASGFDLGEEVQNFSEEDGTASAGVSRERSTKRNSELLSAMITSAVGSIAGVIVIVAAVVFSAAVSIFVLSSDITSYSISIIFDIEGQDDNDVLKGCLTDGEREYMFLLGGEEQASDMYFCFLEPDREYTVNITDGDGGVIFSEVYRTSPYVQKIAPVEYGTLENGALLLQFMPEDMPDIGLQVSIDGIWQEGVLSAENTAFISAELEYGDYDVRVFDPTNGEIYYMSTLTAGLQQIETR